jgi:hypothetical protein
MLRLIVNDLKMNATLLFVVFVLSNVVYLFMARLHLLRSMYSPGGVSVGLAVTSVMVLALFLREELSRGQVIFRSLPLHHSKIILAKYALVILIGLANLAYGISIEVINTYVGPWMHGRSRDWAIRWLFAQLDTGYAMQYSVLARAIAVTIVVSISIPLIIRFGNIWGILLGYLILMLLWSKGIDRLLHFSLYSSFEIGLSRLTFFAVGLMMISVGISYRLSVWLYGRRDL